MTFELGSGPGRIAWCPEPAICGASLRILGKMAGGRGAGFVFDRRRGAGGWSKVRSPQGADRRGRTIFLPASFRKTFLSQLVSGPGVLAMAAPRRAADRLSDGKGGNTGNRDFRPLNLRRFSGSQSLFLGGNLMGTHREPRPPASQAKGLHDFTPPASKARAR